MASSRHKRRMQHGEYMTMHQTLKGAIAAAYVEQPHHYVQGAARGAINAVLVMFMKDETFSMVTIRDLEKALEAFAAGRPKVTSDMVADWALHVTAPRMFLATIGKIHEAQQELRKTKDFDQRLKLTKRITRLQRHQVTLRQIRSVLGTLNSEGPKVPVTA
ncbi:MAG: hypothetical protein WD603_03120 [Patescibacteria group bacterium]